MPTSLAVFWGDTLWDEVGAAADSDSTAGTCHGSTTTWPKEPVRTARLKALAEAADRLQKDFGSWGTAWGQINRFQRINGDIVQPFDDSKPSIPVPFVSSRWGSLASFGAHRWPGTKRYYGTSGNSFVAVVEFGAESPRTRHHRRRRKRPSRIRRTSTTKPSATPPATCAKCISGRSNSQGHTERVYHPGQ